MTQTKRGGRGSSAENREVTLLELVDRLLDRGVLLSGDITISVADVDLVVLGLRLILASAETFQRFERGITSEDAPGAALTAEPAHSVLAERAEPTTPAGTAQTSGRMEGADG